MPGALPRLALMLYALVGTIGIEVVDLEGRRKGCSITAPIEFDISYIGEVDVVFKVQGDDDRQGSNNNGGSGGAGGAGGDSSLTYGIVLDGANVGSGMKCPSAFKLKGLAAGMHELAMVPETGGGAGGAVAAVSGQQGHGERRQQPPPRRFWVAAESFRPGQRFCPPGESDLSSGMQGGKGGIGGGGAASPAEEAGGGGSGGRGGGGGGDHDQGLTFWVVIPGERGGASKSAASNLHVLIC